MIQRILAFCFLIFVFFSLQSQNRITDKNDILWMPVTNSTKLNDKFALHTEYQWRRNNLGITWQQSLLRMGLTYNRSKTVSYQAGYGWILTYPYGDYPIAANGTFTEHRIYQQAQFKTALNDQGVMLINRLRLEQRWLAANNADGSINHWNYVHRVRLNQRYNFPFKAFKKDCYFTLMDEIFIGFGENVAQNVFDQNRLFGLLGWNVSPKVQLELGAINQIVQQGKTVNAKPVFQYNTGPVLGCNIKW
jgi:hypothetical protein